MAATQTALCVSSQFKPDGDHALRRAAWSVPQGPGASPGTGGFVRLRGIHRVHSHRLPGFPRIESGRSIAIFRPSLHTFFSFDNPEKQTIPTIIEHP